MECTEFRRLLDAYIDGELSEEAECELLGHANQCKACVQELREAQVVRDTMAQLDDGIFVPLQAQAAWRDAVRREAGKKTLKKRLRFVYAAAAALIVLVGCTAVLRSGTFAKKELPETASVVYEMPAKSGAQPMAEVAADGVAMSAESAAAPAEAECTARRKIKANDINAARETVASLCAEYGAEITSESAEASECVYRIELPSDSLEDFILALTQVGEVLDAEMNQETGEVAVLELQIVV